MFLRTTPHVLWGDALAVGLSHLGGLFQPQSVYDSTGLPQVHWYHICKYALQRFSKHQRWVLDDDWQKESRGTSRKNVHGCFEA